MAVMALPGISHAQSACTAMWGTIDLDGGSGGTAGQLRYFNTSTNRWIPLSPNIPLTGNGNAIGGDPGTGILYYVNRSSATNNLRSINLNTGVEANVGTLGTTGLPGGTTMASTVGATFTGSGQMFLYLTLTGGGGTEWIGRVNLTTPANTTWTQVLTQNGGANPNLGNSGDIYTDNGGNSWIASNTTPGSLWSINLTPGSANYARTTRSLTIGADLDLLAGVAINPTNGQTYIGAVENATGSVTFALNTTTGAMTLLDNQTVYAPTDMGNCIAAPAAPSVTKSFSPTYQPLSGSTTTLVIDIANTNTAPIWLLRDFVDVFPAGVVVGPIPNLTTGACADSGIQNNTITAAIGSNILTFGAGGRIPAGGCSLSVVVSATASVTAYTNTIPATSLTTTSGSNAAGTSATYKVGTDFDAEKSQCLGVCGTTTTGVITVPGGTTIQYILSVVNSTSGGTGSATFTDTIPGLVTPVLSITANMVGGGTCVTATAVVGGSTRITGTVTNALAGAACNVVVTALVSRTQTVATNITNTLTLAPLAGTSDTDPTNNTSTVPAIVGASAVLTITKSNGVTTVTAGSTFSYTITLANLGPAAAPGTTLTDPSSTGLSCTTVSCAATAGSICPASPFPFTNLTSGVQLTPTFPALSTATFVVTCGVSATGF